MEYNEEKAMRIVKNKGLSFSAAQKWKEKGEIPDKYEDSTPAITNANLKEWYVLKNTIDKSYFNSTIWANLSGVDQRIFYGRNFEDRIPTEKEFNLIKEVFYEKLDNLEMLLSPIGENKIADIIVDNFYNWNKITNNGYALKRSFVLFKKGIRKSFPSTHFSIIKKYIKKLLTDEIKN